MRLQDGQSTLHGSTSGHSHESFLFSETSRMAPGPTRPPIARTPPFLSPEIRWPECEADLSLPHNAEVKNA